ncbi:tyrosine-type recombinase/integrase [Streptomyces sp. NPDC051064]|uniref:tyrosine-type recombinase/integrase n=1 Tax=Streptomyces sp. NPDC051064 TaxID=3365641 RepID=UPI00379551B9
MLQVGAGSLLRTAQNRCIRPHRHPPAFPQPLLIQDQTRHTHETLFTSPRGSNLRRSTFSRRLWAPATRGVTLPDGTSWDALKPGLTFHNLRHTHKTWLIEGNIPDVAQARRLGHTLTMTSKRAGTAPSPSTPWPPTPAKAMDKGSGRGAVGGSTRAE